VGTHLGHIMKVLFLGSHWSIKFSPKDILGWSWGAQYTHTGR
jgi:hypothetical protein